MEFKTFLNLIRALFPIWNFFDRIAYGFELEFRRENSSTWEKISFLQARQGAFSLFINPHHNEALVQFNILEHFARDVQEHDFANGQTVQDLTSYKLLYSFIASKLGTQTIQFKLIAGNQFEKLEVYVSDWISLEQE